MIHFENLELRKGVNDETQPVPLTFDPSLPGHTLHGARRVHALVVLMSDRSKREHRTRYYTVAFDIILAKTKLGTVLTEDLEITILEMRLWK